MLYRNSVIEKFENMNSKKDFKAIMSIAEMVNQFFIVVATTFDRI